MLTKTLYIKMQNAEITFHPDFFDPHESDVLFESLLDEIEWKQEKIKLYGKEMNMPRQMAWYGDRGKSYTFSRLRFTPKPWTSTLLYIKEKIEPLAEVSFNSVLLNLYRDGRDSMAWHSDAEPELGKNPTIGSVSLGGTRKFKFRNQFDRSLKHEIELTHGSFLLMAGETQHFWQHEVPKTAKAVKPRINLTFRAIL